MKDSILSSALSPNKKSLAVLTWDGVYLYDSATLEEQWYHRERIRFSHDIGWLNDDELLLLPGRDLRYILSAEDGSILREVSYPLHAAWITFSPNGKYLSVNDSSMWDSATGKALFALPGSDFNFVIWMPDSKHFIYFAYESPITIWDVESGEVVQQLENEYPSVEIWGDGLSTDSRYFAYFAYVYDPRQGKWIHRTILWDLLASETIPVERLEGEPADYGWQLDDQIIVLDNGYVIRLDGSKAQMTTLPVTAGNVIRLPDGLLVVLVDAIMRYGKDFKSVAVADGHDSSGFGDANSVLSPDGKLLAIGVFSRYYVWDIERNELMTVFADPMGFHGAAAAWSPSGDMLAIGTHIRGQIYLWDAHSHSSLKTILTGYHVCEIEWLDESSLAITLTDKQTPYDYGSCPLIPSYNYFLAVLNVESGRIVYLEQRRLSPIDLTCSPDGRYLAFQELSGYTVDSVSRLVIWDPTTYRNVLITDIEMLAPIGWLPGSHSVAVFEGESLHIRIFDAETHAEQSIRFRTWEPFFFGQFLPVNHQFVNLDTVEERIRWSDGEGNMTVGDMPFWSIATEPIMTTEGRIFVAVQPSISDSDIIVLLELLPPEE